MPRVNYHQKFGVLVQIFTFMGIFWVTEVYGATTSKLPSMVVGDSESYVTHKGRRQKKKLVLLGGAHHKVATPPLPQLW